MDQQTWTLLMDKLERIEKQNEDQLGLIRQHVEKDESYYKKVDKHDTYFGIVWIGLGAVGSVVMGLVTKLFDGLFK